MGAGVEVMCFKDEGRDQGQGMQAASKGWLKKREQILPQSL